MVQLGLILEYEVAFPDEPSKPIAEYFVGASRERVLKLGAFLLGHHNRHSQFSDSRSALGLIFGHENNILANEIYRRIREQENKTGKPIRIFHPYSSLRLFEEFFKHAADQENVPPQTAPELERNFFKAYLLTTSVFLKEQSVGYKSTKHLESPLAIPMMLFCTTYPYSDKTNYELSQLWVTQTIKAVLLFKFLEARPETKGLLAAFLEFYRCVDWKHYMVKFIPLTLSTLKKERETYTDIIIEEGEEFNDRCDFLDYFIIYEGELPEEELDFLTLRSKPLYRVSRGHYRIVYDLFVVEKIHKGMYFALRNINDRLSSAAKVKDFKSFYGKQFSESVLTYTAIQQIYPDRSTQFSGDAMDQIMSAAPDYYVRRGRSILLFESKDFLVPVDKKNSYDFEIYDQVFEERLYFTEKNGKQSNKAVGQLIDNIKRILSVDFPPDNGYKPRQVDIYPIIIVHDHQYDTPGLRELVNSWFTEELECMEQDGAYTRHVRPLVIINIDQLLYYQVPLANDIQLHEVIEEYLDFVKPVRNLRVRSREEMESKILEKTVPFSVFITNYMAKKGHRKLPPLLNELGLELFDKNIT